MPPSVALLASFLLVMLVLWWSKDRNDSSALWLPVIWLFLTATKLPSLWFDAVTATSPVAASEEGNALDRTVYLALLAGAFWVLARRRINWSEFFARNSVLVLYVGFALLSVSWSDYRYVSFKRWIRDLTPYAMALVVLSERSPLMAITTVMRRLSYILVTLSLVLIRYYPGVGILYNFWSGEPEYVGASTGKNSLGLICLVALLFLFWDTLAHWPERKSRTEKLILVANLTFIAVALRLFLFIDSATSRGCLIVGCVIILVVRSKRARANPRLFTMAIPTAVVGYILLESVFDLSRMIAWAFGRDPTMTGRTEMWKVFLERQTNPLIGLGYGSLWTGNRMALILSRLDTAYLNETHNGYLDVYLNLGLIGLVLFVMFLLSSYRRICNRIVVSPHYAAFAVAFWVVAVLYNITETAVGGTVWSVLLFFSIVAPRTEHAQALPDNPRLRSRRTAIGDRRA